MPCIVVLSVQWDRDRRREVGSSQWLRLRVLRVQIKRALDPGQVEGTVRLWSLMSMIQRGSYALQSSLGHVWLWAPARVNLLTLNLFKIFKTYKPLASHLHDSTVLSNVYLHSECDLYRGELRYSSLSVLPDAEARGRLTTHGIR